MVTDFILRREHALSKEVCDKLITLFEESTDLHYNGVVGRTSTEDEEGLFTGALDEIKKSTDMTFGPQMLDDPIWGDILKEEIIPVLESAIEDYKRYWYVGCDNIDKFVISTFFNLQRYNPEEGYKVFHCERCNNQFYNRTHAWLIYLNDVEVGGETEFYYQQHFERAEAGKLVAWPADFTHMHRGIVAPNETKYVLTGWFGFEGMLPIEYEDGSKPTLYVDERSHLIIMDEKDD